jgi:hypothetical protein
MFSRWSPSAYADNKCDVTLIAILKQWFSLNFLKIVLQGDHGGHGDSFLKNFHELHVLPVKNSARLSPNGAAA